MTCFESWNLTVNIVIAISTFGAVVLALFGDYIKNAIFKVKLSVEIVDVKGELTNWSPIINQIRNPKENSGSQSSQGNFGTSGTSGNPFPNISPMSIGPEVIYYHLRIKNQRPSIIVNKCRVLLKELHSKDPITQEYKKLTLVVPPNFQWTPAETSPPAIDFITEQILDFGYLTKGADAFTPAVSPRYNSFKGNLKANEIIKYTLEIQANNAKPKIVEIEVSWDGIWNSNLDKMKFKMEKK